MPLKGLEIMSKYLIIFMFIATPCYADKHKDNSGHIIHSRALPVVLHKIVPPFKGVHKFKK